MAKFSVLKVNEDDEFYPCITSAPDQDDYGRVMLRKHESIEGNYEIVNSSNWTYNNETKTLHDKKGNTLKPESELQILQIINFFDNLNDAVTYSFKPNKQIIGRIDAFISNLIAKHKSEIHQHKEEELNKINSEKHGSLISRGRLVKKIEKYQNVLCEIESIIESKQPLKKDLQSQIELVIKNHKIKNKKFTNEINEILKSKHYLPKKRAILARISEVK